MLAIHILGSSLSTTYRYNFRLTSNDGKGGNFPLQTNFTNKINVLGFGAWRDEVCRFSSWWYDGARAATPPRRGQRTPGTVHELAMVIFD